MGFLLTVLFDRFLTSYRDVDSDTIVCVFTQLGVADLCCRWSVHREIVVVAGFSCYLASIGSVSLLLC